jgi:hypothetical protein
MKLLALLLARSRASSHNPGAVIVVRISNLSGQAKGLSSIGRDEDVQHRIHG